MRNINKNILPLQLADETFENSSTTPEYTMRKIAVEIYIPCFIFL